MVRFEHNGELLRRRLGAMSQRIRRPQALLEDIGEHLVHTSIPKTFEVEGRPTRWPRSAWSSEKQQNASGGRGLVGSIRHEVNGDRLRVGTNKRYARQRQFGGTIRARNARALAVPLPDVPRTMRRTRRWGGRLFRLPVVSGDPNTQGILAIKGPSGDPEPKFVLRRAVTQPARPFLAWQDEDRAYIAQAVSRAMLEEAGA